MNGAGAVAVVTGVTSGVGRGLAVSLARAGYAVVGSGRRADAGAALEAEVRADGGELSFVAADVRQVDDCERLIDVARSTHGRLDLLVNNAATVGEPALCSSHLATESWWDSVLDTNLKGAFFCARYALEVMVGQGGGSIVNMCSAMGVNVGPPRMAAYTASKAALIALSKTLAIEYADRGVRVNAIVLGAAEGETADRMHAARASEMAAAGQPAPPLGGGARMTGQDVAGTVLFLASDDARHINGAAIALDDGVTAGLLFARLFAPPQSPLSSS